MDDLLHNTQLIDKLIAISKEAGEAILKVYNSDFDYQIKEDLSPLTKADTLSHHIICKRLAVLTPDIPILSEEDSDIPFNIRSQWKQYWLVDPLDGTKEFIKKNGEFTVNIALIENNIPILGAIYIPVSDEIFWGTKRYGSFYKNKNQDIERINVSKNIYSPIRIITSRSHPYPKLDSLLKEIKDYEVISRGSSLKFCLIAKGDADFYPRFGPTSEWDIAAGDAIVRFAGGYVLNTNGLTIKYNCNPDFIIPNFIALSSKIIFNKYYKNKIK
ncbi:3'(2'),5'-bisphosphate nucleotidase CysQ [Gammaproteobacteria bacterium]|nr:3'(2'),5'-bisphosphate nucleotidase CysQ [Gammaproteobacteria bacterium]